MRIEQKPICEVRPNETIASISLGLIFPNMQQWNCCAPGAAVTTVLKNKKAR